jgi:hypothetical protein
MNDHLVFNDFETMKFPEESCFIPNAHEPGVMDSADVYLCVVVDKRWPKQCRIEYLRPYTAKDGQETLFGWAQIDFDGYVDHVTMAIHRDRERVVAWKLVDSPQSFMPTERWDD